PPCFFHTAPPTTPPYTLSLHDALPISQRVRAVYLAERERWIRSLEISGREEVLFELEMLLRGIDRFFNLRNLFGERLPPADRDLDRKSTRLNSSHVSISYAVFCLKKKK